MNKPSPLRRLLSLRARSSAPAPAGPVDELAQARALIAAIDAGGIPLYPGKVNQIARALGLEVRADFNAKSGVFYSTDID